MKNFVSIDAGPLYAALKLCTAVIEKRNTYPILGMVRLMVRDGVLTVSGTDLDIHLSRTLTPRDSGGDWSACVAIQGLANIASIASGGGVVIEQISDDQVQVSLDQVDLFNEASYSLIGVPADGFPDIDGERGELVETFAHGRLAQLLGRVSWAMSTEATRYYLNGVAWQRGPFGRRVAATDGNRLATCTYDGGDRVNAVTSRVLPSKLVRLIGQFGTAAEVRVHDLALRGGSPAVEIDAGDTVVRARLIDLPSSGYPDIDRVIPRRENFKAQFAPTVERLDAALTGVLALAPRKGGGKFVRFARDQSGMLAVTSNHPDYGTSKIVLPDAWPETGEAFGLNARYLRDVLRSCAGTLQIHQVDPGAPITILDEDQSMLRILMPMRA